MEGQRLGGRYQIESRVGGGGMAIVYKAKDLILNRPVAVKVLRSQFGTDEDFVNRFRREAQAVASLSHPNVVGVYDVGQEGDTYYMVMEYIEGYTLKEVIIQRGALPVEEAVRIAEQICDALDHAHQNQIIHRDIKPHNIMIGKNGRVKVTDFGIARAVTSATITHTNAMLGSVHYFSPEQARGGITGEKSDIYSLGIVLYEMVTGELPFSGDSPISVALKHLQEPLPEPRQVNPAIPQSVENVILKALVKDPFLRYASASEMLEDLETCLFPERLNEEKLTFPVDEEMTRVVPIITPDMLEGHTNGKTGGAGRSRYEQRTEEEDAKPAKKQWWVKALLWVGGIGLFFVLAFFGFNLLLNLFPSVPEAQVPHVEGIEVTLAEKKIQDAKLVARIVEEANDTIEKGMVIRQDPAPPMRLKENSVVTLYVSKGQQEINMPNLVTLPRATAEEALKSNGFKLENVTFVEEEDDKAEVGTVIKQSPAANEKVFPTKTNVTVTISKGKAFVKMPDVRNISVEAAQVELYKRGLTVGKITEVPTYTTDKRGIVLSTHPYDPGMDVQKDVAVPLEVSNGQYPQDAKLANVPVYVEVVPGETLEVKIEVTDARGEAKAPLTETITESKEYDVPIVLAPQKDSVVKVFVKRSTDQGFNEYQTIPVSYNSLP
ncbi:Stk1 family PASTA domain-containing Ser/Thr kinase [Brevibacillus porteri]|uniref:non-specific serine/threonine protein kinase n=1 Tax=Brevibacillus porteri TaxID=2126350 RepID=A0ABX5FN31_9BACL|nr:Stk1 family PASTA domain-containing Ser/Thr kinase [Brevibacillus porteri]MED1802617.1 Stk1 family PASTA domain-containing Ser/Thr kinase [Brevibacillus porteri]MED2133716.1 Stk1 family PASTA domain-containing Ser/Thr kinase [Brevibacillus porteri]MED2747563.1 Stk1 family PASTA domain-containing Ser/Thr kinase [Brevibacillus porteri]MED2813494.1 Stk1 family PASTA domain-containing Ser/Thr kinase [Brevibacillus porteri]MED2892754.1 Stk1 family PASTA domain-containing Ser/Thr kinase [Brevibac